MKVTRLWTLGLLALLTLAPWARPQAFVPVQAEGAGGFVSVSAVGGMDGVAPGMFTQATAGGRTASNVSNVQIGFDYIRPFWTSRDFTLAVPAAAAGSFPLLGDIGHVDNHFGLAPTVKYKYDIEDIGLAFKATGTFLSLTGQLERRITATGVGEGVLTANSTLTLVTANLPEVSVRLYADELFKDHGHRLWSLFDDVIIDLGVGTRYSSITQNYTGSLTNTVAGGANTSTRYSTQSFQGLGITGSIDLSCPIKQNWVLFTSMRGSILVGNNNKESNLTVNVIGTQATSDTLNQSRTEFIPVAEVALGTECGYELGQRMRDGLPPSLMTLRVAATGQFWGDVGPLSAGSPQGYGNSHLFLAGVHIMVGVHR